MTASRPAELLRRIESDTPDDAELFARFRRGDQGAFATLVRRHGPLVLAVCRRITNQPQDAEDAFQATFLALIRRAESIREPRLIGNWLYGAALRVSKRAKRSSMRRRMREVQAVNVSDPPAPGVAVPFEHEAAVHDEIANLPELHRVAVVLCELRGVSRAEAAAMLGIPEGTLSSRLAAGRKKLAERLSRRGIALGAALVPLAAVPDALVAATCRFAAGAAAPAAIERLLCGGFPMRTVLIGVLGFGLAAAGVVLAAKPEDQPPVVVETPPVAAEKKADRKTDDKVEYSTKPRLQKTMDLQPNVRRLVWSPDGKWFLLDCPNVVFWKPDTATRGELELAVGQRFAGITPDSKYVVTDLRESGLLSGLHAVQLWHMMSERGNPMGGLLGGPPNETRIVFERSKDHTLDPEASREYGFPAGGETIRTVHTSQDKSGMLNRVEVFESKLGSASAKSVFKTETSCESVLLSPSGNRIALLNKTSVTVHDIAANKSTTFGKLPEANPPGNEKDSRRRSAGFSRDESKLVTSLHPGTPVILDLKGGAPVVLANPDDLRIAVNNPSFTADNRLVTAVASRMAMGGRQLVGSAILVWNAESGAIVKTWETSPPRQVLAGFHPMKPMLTILEPNGASSRLGFWDFSAESEKK